MREALHTRTRNGRQPMLTVAERDLLDNADNAPLLARLDAATCEFFPGLEKHIRQVALVVLRAKSLSRTSTAATGLSVGDRARRGRR